MEQLFQDIKNYVDLRTKRMKLRMVEQLSGFCSRMASMVIVILTALLAILSFAVAGGIFLYDLLGSALLASLLVGVYFLLWAIFLYLVRKRLFSGVMVRTFSKMFFEDHSDKSGEEGRDE